MVELARQRQTQPCIAQGTKLERKVSYDLRPSNSFTLRYTCHWHVQQITCFWTQALIFFESTALVPRFVAETKDTESIARCFRVHGWLCYPRSLQRTMNGNSSLFFRLSTFIIKFPPLSWQRVVSFGTLEALAIPKKPNHLLSLIEVRWPWFLQVNTTCINTLNVRKKNHYKYDTVAVLWC